MSLFKHTQVASGLAEALLRASVILDNGLVAKSDLEIQQEVSNPEEYKEYHCENYNELK